MKHKHCRKLFIFVMIVAVLAGTSTLSVFAWYATVTASSFGVHHWAPWYEPHYGATFAGSYVSSITFLGSGGNSATCNSSAGCITGWNWVDNNTVLLIPKGGWLFDQAPWGDRWQANKYQAEVWIN